MRLGGLRSSRELVDWWGRATSIMGKFRESIECYAILVKVCYSQTLSVKLNALHFSTP